MKLSRFGQRLTRRSGARELMDDLGAAMSGEVAVRMLGGGNPAHIPEVQARFRERLAAIAASPAEFDRMLSDYASPAGETRFRRALAALLRREYGWEIGPGNIALTSGSQSAFFLLFNLLAGEFGDGALRRVLLPMAPEYIGYADQGLADGLFLARRPTIDELDGRMFKYRVDFDALDVDESISLVCVSRPTNPTGNVLTDDEVAKLHALARDCGLPLLIDNAYGLPFPGIIFRDIDLVWDEDVILCMSLSKVGLPAARTGIVVASEELVDALTSVNAIVNLAVGSAGPVLAGPMVESGELIRLSRDVITPFYRARAEQAIEWLHAALAGCEYRIHVPEGAIFLWLWFPGLPISSDELYRRLKARGVLVLSGHHFFPGLDEPWRHRQECIRVTYSQELETVRDGIGIIAEEVRRAYAEAA